MASRRIRFVASCIAAFLSCLAARLDAAWILDGTGVCTAVGTQDYVHTVSDGAGGAFVAWRDGRGTSFDIYVQHIDAEGNSLWTSDGVAVCTESSDQNTPKVAPDGAGGTIIVWMDERSGASDANIFVQRVNDSGVVQWDVDGVPLCTATGIQNVPQIIEDGAGGAIVTWQDARSDEGDIYVQRVNHSGSPLWTPNGVAVCIQIDAQSVPVITTDCLDGAIIVWEDYRSSDSDIYGRHITGAGTTHWTANGVLLSNADGPQQAPQVCSDGLGGVIAVWNDGRSGDNWDIYAQRVHAMGSPFWGAGGFAICTADLDQNNPKLVGDGSEGAIITWQDQRSGTYLDIYVQRVNGAGAVLWTPDGVAACTAGGDQGVPLIVSDGAHGAILAWEDQRSIDYDVYAQHLDAAGTALWEANGAMICAATGDQHDLNMTVGEPGGAIVAWKDNRVGSDNIYASATPMCSVSPTYLDFGYLHQDYANQDFIITNTGGGWLSGSVSEACAGYSLMNADTLYGLAPDSSKTFTVRFQPTAVDTYYCTIETGTACADVDCFGVGVGPACWRSADTLDFGSVPVDGYENRDLIITNLGGLRLTGNVTESCSDFSFVSGGGPFDIGGGDTLVVTVRFAPSTPGPSSCVVSTGGACGSVVCLASGDRKPVIHLVRDVPGDQGGLVNVAWYASPGDDPITHAITRYTIWRAIDMTAAELVSLAPGSIITSVSDLPKETANGVVRMELLGATTYFWKLMSSVDAYYLDGYSEVVPTLFDSTGFCDEYHYVQIIAHTSDPYTFWISDPDSGRSVDNLAPAPPEGLSGEQRYMPSGLLLTWSPNDEADLADYAIYRGTDAGFVPDAFNLVASMPDTMFLDGDWHWDAGYYYKVAAVDIHGNESGYAVLGPDGVTGAETQRPPDETYLAQNYPNPFNPSTIIRYELATRGRVQLRIYDVSGALVRVLEDRDREPGRYEVGWDGTNDRGEGVGSGVYLYVLEAPDARIAKKMLCMK